MGPTKDAELEALLRMDEFPHATKVKKPPRAGSRIHNHLVSNKKRRIFLYSLITQNHQQAAAMPLPPNTTPAPTSVLVPGTSPAPRTDQEQQPESHKSKGKDFEVPKIRLEIRDLSHAGASSFLTAVHAADVLASAIRNVLRCLYSSPSCPTTTAPPTRSVTLILRDMPGVAYTTGSDLDNDHKEIHFSLRYIAGIRKDRLAHEITGVVTHEVVHCYQHNAFGTCPGGLIEGIADWVRLSCRLSPPHWKRHADGDWDGGYERTAYFLEYLEDRFGEGTVRRLNEKLRIQRYQEKQFWTELVGRPVEQLWGDYREKLKDDDAVVVSKEDVSEDECHGTPSSTGS